MKYFYSAGAMGYGKGWWWHRFFNFPKLPFVTKTLTLYQNKGNKYLVIPDFRGSIYNKVGLDNIGMYAFIGDFGMYNFTGEYRRSKTPRTISLAGPDEYILKMITLIDLFLPKNDNIELNFSCPNVESFENKWVPKTSRDVYLKLNWTQNPYNYDLYRVKGIRLNSIPMKFCGGSGKIAQEKNWAFISKYNKEGLNVAGCSAQNFEDVKILEDMGCTEIGIGSAILTHPFFVEKLL
jgi:dihydroorotate dehydrogenase